jgi:hypothetical protein
MYPVQALIFTLESMAFSILEIANGIDPGIPVAVGNESCL